MNGKKMNHTGKAGKPRDKPLKVKGATQFQRFVETAKALEVDESGKTFEKPLDVVVPAKPAVNQPRPSAQKACR